MCISLWLALLGLIDSPNNPNRGFNLTPAAHPSSTPTLPLLLTHPLINATHDIAVVVEKAAHNPTVLQLASRNSYKTLTKQLFQFYGYNLAQENHSGFNTLKLKYQI